MADVRPAMVSSLSPRALSETAVVQQQLTSWGCIRSYKNTTKLIEEVNRIKIRKNLLLWYTADELAHISSLEVLRR
jgi:hypothetical protein